MDLLQKRYLVIADYPLSELYFKVGDVLTWNEINQCFYGGNDARLHKNTVESYPHLFRELQWWEMIEEKDMPEYVKYYFDEQKEWIVCKIDRYEINAAGVIGYTKTFGINKLYIGNSDLPATLQEYNDYIKNNNK